MPFPPRRKQRPRSFEDRAAPPPPPPARTAPPETGIRELLVFLRDTFRDAADRIDSHLAPPHSRARTETERSWPEQRPSHPRAATPEGSHIPLESLREEVRGISQDAASMDAAELRLRVEAVTAETRAIQDRATDPEDQDIAAKILRALTAIVSEHRPGHVYGLARHHQANWEEVGRRARDEIAQGGPAEDPEEPE